MLIIFLLLLILILIFIISKRRRTCLLLTMCVNVRDEKENRIKWYTDCINRYLYNTNLELRVVESSGYEFQIQHERLKQHTFVSELDKNVNFPTNGEVESIIKAYDSGMLNEFDMIVKITGKYYVPELEEELLKIPDDCGIVYQNGYWNEESFNCEIFGFEQQYIEPIFIDMFDGSTYLEKHITNIHEKLKCKSYTIPKKMKVECIDTCPHKTNKNEILKEL